MKKKQIFIIELLLGLLIASAISLIFYGLHYTPSGHDIWGHLFKTEFLADQINAGNFYPLYSADWYNGIQLYRYWPIFTYYITGGITLITGNPVISYYIYLGLTFFIGYLGWCLIANREDRKSFIIIGVLWWFLPDNTRVLFSEGNLARVMITSLLPLFMYFFTYLIEERKRFIPTVIMVFLLTNTHFMITAMCAIIFCIYGFFQGLKKNSWYLGFLSFICGFLLSGLTLIPGIAGGIVSDGNSASTATMADWSQDLFKSLFYWDRNFTSLCFGLFMLLAAFSVLVLSKKGKTGTIIALIFFVLSDIMFIPLLIQLPLSQVWWMARFAPMCFVLILYEFGFVECKRGLITALSLLFVIDTVPMYSSLHYPDKTDLDYMLFDEAVELTDSRLGILDESLFSSYPSYATYKKVPYVQGWAIQGASTKNNIVSATESMRCGWYGYTFKQMIELGCDTVIVNRGILDKGEAGLMEWAAEYGYELAWQTDSVYLFDNRGIDSTYGFNITYDGIAIGKSSEYICYMYPQIKKGDSDKITDYSFEELSQYKMIYLSNFEYSDFQNSEEMIKMLSDAGVKIYIDSTHLPINSIDIRSIFGIESRFLNTEGFFNLKYDKAQCIAEIPYEWNATYLATEDDSVELYKSDGIGFMAKKDNITVIGLNLVYLNFENPTDSLKLFLDTVFELRSAAPECEIIPMTYDYDSDKIIIKSDKPGSTTLAYQDNFDGNVGKEHNLVTVGRGETQILIFYKYFTIGLYTMIFGAATTVFTACIIRRQNNEKKKRRIAGDNNGINTGSSVSS